MGTTTRRNHVVSKFYLRYFADEAEQVTTVMLPGDRSFAQSIGNASVETNFYTALGNDGEETDVAEEAFGQIEGAAADAWREMAAGRWPLSEQSRVDMAGWIALQHLRGQSVRRSMDQIGTDGLHLDVMVGGRHRLRQRLIELGQPHDDEAVDHEWIDFFKSAYFIRTNANHHLEYLAEALPKMMDLLLDRWWLLTVFERKGLATSDHPVYVVPNPENQEMGLGTGIGNAHMVHVPLTRRHSLALARRDTLAPELAAIGQGHDHHAAGVTQTALYSNSCAVNSARRALFHHPADTPLTGLPLHPPREREVSMSGDPWRFMADDDRQVLIDAGLTPPGEGDEIA